MDDIIIVGAGVGGLTLGLALHRPASPVHLRVRPRHQGDRCRINLLPHATKELAALGLEDQLSRVAIETQGCNLLQPLRTTYLPGAAGPRGRLRPSAIFDPSRRPADGAAGGLFALVQVRSG